jgi:hypothetical protein
MSDRRLRTATLLALVLGGASGGVDAQHRLGGPLVDGTVVRARGCGSHFFVIYHQEYALAEWLGGDMVRENEVLQSTDPGASLEREGRVTFVDLATGHPIDFVIEKALMSPAEYAQAQGQVCR